ncbi:acyltransferase family protein [Enterobacter hormaechei subsp. steigerwaltii]|uniref:acyltransferase family protein n=1 Tax=Enterobacter hormaechei TaxID=158836 RepID=UPI003F43036E
MSRNNCFDFLRLFAAVMVVVYHHAGFMRVKIFNPSDYLPLESIWVQIFITISGFLVTKSFMTSKGFDQYIFKRCLRIFPALIICSFVVVYFILPFWESSPFGFIFSYKTFYSFVNMSMMHGINISGVESPYGFQTIVNPPLWTLPYEFVLYIILGVTMLIHRGLIAPVISLFVIIFIVSGFPDAFKNAYFYSINYLALMKFGINFFVGSIMFLTFSVWNNKKHKAFIALISLLILFYLSGNKFDLDVVGRIALAALTIVVGVSFAFKYTSGKFDISYGVYIWGWPIQAVVIQSFDLGFTTSLFIALSVTFAVAFISRVTVEEYFLKKK